ncbi:hypothetical protein [Rubinisphaera margarita]|uniref:hypothetical protein n=1 Tax=Rubinisphaera margarita TaxID=2909586 RepID=UPI001EE995A1|nr:hypothetical protein [Rubinisphaera margarita]MCG6157016.1 hypothetical protein [Rubinisphaera margarita]
MSSFFRPPRSLELFLLGKVDFSSAQALQKLFAEEVRATRIHRAAILICEHPKSTSSGTEAISSREYEDPELVKLRRSAVPMIRPGGLWEHGPGQLGVYSTFSLAQTELSAISFRDEFARLIQELCREVLAPQVSFTTGAGHLGRTGLIARSGHAARQSLIQGATYINVNRTYRLAEERNSSSLSSETMQRVGLPAVKTSLVDLINRWLDQTEITVFSRHPLLSRISSSNSPK